MNNSVEELIAQLLERVDKLERQVEIQAREIRILKEGGNI